MDTEILTPEKARYNLPYCENPFYYQRRQTREVKVGDVGIGGENPIRIQSMTIADTLDTEATVREIVDLHVAGCEIARVTVPSIKHAENLKAIKAGLKKQGIKIPLVADIHFTPNAALIAADWVEKVRVNPGNYADKKKFAVREYTDQEYEVELQRIEEAFKPLVLKCKKNGVAMRIGTNHGSLSDRIMNRFGDTPEGMVESALEFIRVCEKYDYHEIVLSMKASNTLVMIAAYRLLTARMYEEDMDYPLHLGVTEAGDGEDGRIKSAVGIGTLLEDGLGDTIRVSLTEDAVHEIPVACHIAAPYTAAAKSRPVGSVDAVESRDPFHYTRNVTHPLVLSQLSLGGTNNVAVGTTRARQELGQVFGLPAFEIVATSVNSRSTLFEFASEFDIRPQGVMLVDTGSDYILAREALQYADLVQIDVDWQSDFSALAELVTETIKYPQKGLVFRISYEEEYPSKTVDLLKVTLAGFTSYSIFLDVNRPIGYNRVLLAVLEEAELVGPIILSLSTDGSEDTLYKAAIKFGALLCDGFGDAILLNCANRDSGFLLNMMNNILQATRVRISKTEFISCPSCGRTQFELQEVTAKIKARTSHLKGLKIAIMGCIVNGPGEMADADFGYVGSGVGKISLYVGKELVKRNLSSKVAVEELVELIKSEGQWVEPGQS